MSTSRWRAWQETDWRSFASEGGSVLTDDPVLAATEEALATDHAAAQMSDALRLDQLDRLPEQSARRVRGARQLLNQLCRFRVSLACTEPAGLRYRLGGMSNPETPRPAELARAGR
jgi:hypothetical protein